MPAKARAWVAGVGAAVLFLYVLFSIALEPAVSSDLYPKMSTLRTDPMGAKALFESLRETPGLRVERSYRPIDQLAGVKATVFLAGEDASDFETDSGKRFDSWEKVVSQGGRLAIAFAPEVPDVPFEAPKEFSKPKSAAARDSHLKLPETSLERFGIRLKRVESTWEKRAELGSKSRETALYFEPADPSWIVIERSQSGKAVIAERAWKKGSLILVARNYPLSNEGLRELHPTSLIARMIGPWARVIFDESHLGIVETGSVGAMLRRYGFQGAAAMLLALGLLFIWKMSSSLLPPKRIDDPKVLEGEAASAGLAHLMRRSVPRPKLLAACWTEWDRSAAMRPFAAESRQARARESLGDSDPVRGYKNIQKALSDPS